ncbi:MAG: organoarsenical effux MFS transporter ArsJ [Boseongicola sp.]|nr:organoarsenical effux MFS transporter ArsJ [Boseongicola sp.]MDD9976338.1 organoarsenical effux MFS transporter ArsJ [Boseongicola sp.]
MSDVAPSGLKAYVAVTAAYWAFMLTDGALRMLVLLHFHTLGFSPVQLAYLFLLYEFMGIVTNLSAGWLAARFGLTSTLYGGLALQVIALVLLTQLDPSWSVTTSVVFVMAVQGLSGIAKDLAKMSSKSAVKLLAPSEDGALFRWVAALTGSKNAVKGLGFLLGAALLAWFGFIPALGFMAAVLTLILLAVFFFMPPGLPGGVKGTKFTAVFAKDRNINVLSLARMFLFGARDTWFVVGIPIFFYGVLSDGSEDSARRAFFLIGTFMAVWVIGYGFVQATAPRWLGARMSERETIQAAQKWVLVLCIIPAALAVAAYLRLPGLTGIVVFGLLVFGVVFALNSALHSYLILAFTSTERVTLDVGFYYMANAAGRLLGTLLSGLSYQIGGVALCLGVAALMAGLSWVAALRLATTAPAH